MSAIEPVEQIQHHVFASPFSTDLPALLRRLAELPDSIEAPYLTLSLDWRAHGTRPAMRSGRFYLDQDVADLIQQLDLSAHTPPYESLSADLERVRGFLDGDIDPAVKGIFIFACSANSVFETVLLGNPVENNVETGPTPALLSLARIVEDEPPYLVALFDQKHAQIMLVDHAAELQQVEIEAHDYPRHQSQGGWSQRRYQMRADERIDAFIRTLAQETQKALTETGAASLVLAGNEQLTTSLRDELHPSVQERLAGTIRLGNYVSDSDAIKETLPLAQQAEREREFSVVQRIENGAGPGGGSATDIEETLTALQAGQVMILAMNDDFTSCGWADFSLPVFGSGEIPAEHPAGGDVNALVPVAIEEQLVRLALQQDAEIEIIRTRTGVDWRESTNGSASDAARTEAATRLDAVGGGGAILRFALSDTRSAADL